MKRLTKFLIVCMVWFSVPAYALDSYTDDMTTTTGWVDADSGTTAAWTQEAHDGFPCFKFSIPTAGTTRYSATYRVLPVSGQNLNIKFSAWLVNVGTNANIDAMQIFLNGSAVTANAPFFRLCSDGFFVRKADGAFVEVGTNIVDVGDFRTDWEIRVTAPTPSTARMQIWKNGVKVAENIDCSYPTTTTAYNRLTFQHAAYTLNNSLSYISNLDVKSWGLNYHENMDSITDWTDADVGNGISEQGTGVMVLRVPTASGTSTATRRYFHAANFYANKYIVETRIKFTSLGATPASDSLLVSSNRTTTLDNTIAFCSSGLFRRTAASTYTEIGTDIVDIGDFTTWRFEFDTFNNTVGVVKNGVRIASGLSQGFATTGATEGRFAFNLLGYNTTPYCEIDYLRIYSEDGQLIQTIIE